MSADIFTRIYLAPTDHVDKVAEFLKDMGADFESEGDEQPDEEGYIVLDLKYSDSQENLIQLCGLGLSFLAHYDSSGEGGGSKFLFVSHRREWVMAQESINRHCPAVAVVNVDGEIDPRALALCRKYWKLKDRVDAHARKLHGVAPKLLRKKKVKA